MAKTKKDEWQTGSGAVMKIKNMTDEHLINSIKYMERSYKLYIQQQISIGYGVLSGMQGEMACYAIEQEINSLERGDNDFIEDVYPKYPMLIHEFNRRKLNDDLIVS